MPYKLFFKKFEKGRAYFKDEKNQTIVLPENYIKEPIKENVEFFLNISKEDNLAKDVLNELLNTDK